MEQVESVTIRVRLSQAEWLEACLISVPRWKYYSNWLLPPLFVFAAIFAYASSRHSLSGFSMAWTDFSRELPAKLIAAGAGALVCFACIWQSTRMSRSKHYLRFVSRCPESKWAFLADRHLIEASGGESASVPWGSYSEWKEGNSVLVLRTKSRAIRILPKSAFSTGELDEVRRILGRALPRKM